MFLLSIRPKDFWRQTLALQARPKLHLKWPSQLSKLISCTRYCGLMFRFYVQLQMILNNPYRIPSLSLFFISSALRDCFKSAHSNLSKWAVLKKLPKYKSEFYLVIQLFARKQLIGNTCSKKKTFSECLKESPTTCIWVFIEILLGVS